MSRLFRTRVCARYASIGSKIGPSVLAPATGRCALPHMPSGTWITTKRGGTAACAVFGKSTVDRPRALMPPSSARRESSHRSSMPRLLVDRLLVVEKGVGLRERDHELAQ